MWALRDSSKGMPMAEPLILATNISKNKKSLKRGINLCGRSGIRTPDPLLVRQML